MSTALGSVTFDAGALIALDRDDRRVVVLLARAAQTNASITVPATALAQAIRRPERQARLARLVRQPGTAVVALDRVDATNVGRLLAASGTSDIVDAHVVVCARRSGQRVVTSDPATFDASTPSLSSSCCDDRARSRPNASPAARPTRTPTATGTG